MPSNSDYLVIDIKIVGLKVSIDIHLVATVEAVVASLNIPLVSVLISIPRHLPQVRVVARGQPGQEDRGPIKAWTKIVFLFRFKFFVNLSPGTWVR